MAQTVFRFYPEFVYTRIFLADEGGESSQSADEVTLSNVMAAAVQKIRAVLNNGLRELNRGMAGKSAFSLNQSLMKEISDSAACYELAVLDVIDAMPEPPGLAAEYSAMKDEQIRPRLREGMRKNRALHDSPKERRLARLRHLDSLLKIRRGASDEELDELSELFMTLYSPAVMALIDDLSARRADLLAAVPAAGSSGGISDAERRAASGMLMEPLRQLTIEIKMKVSEVHAFRGRIRQQ